MGVTDNRKNKKRQSEVELLFDPDELPSLLLSRSESSFDGSPMDLPPQRSWVVWATGLVLAVSSGIFGTVMIGSSLAYPDVTAFKASYFLLLVALPLMGVLGLVRRKPWGREIALLSLVSLWAFTLQGAWSIFGENPLLAFRNPLTLSVFIFLIVLLTALPSLFAKLRWGAAAREFFGV